LSSRHVVLRTLYSFPTRRSSDLQMHHQLAAVADAQDGHPPGEDLGITAGRILQVDAVGPARENDPLGVLGTDHRGVGLIGINLTDRKSTRLNSSHVSISYAVFCL